MAEDKEDGDNWIKSHALLTAEVPDRPDRQYYKTNRMGKTRNKEQTKPYLPDNFGIRPSDAVVPDDLVDEDEIYIDVVGKNAVDPLCKNIDEFPFIVPELRENLKMMNFTQFREVQRYIFAIIRKYQMNPNTFFMDMVVSAPPRYGKSVGYMIPAINYCSSYNTKMENESEKPYKTHYPRFLIIFNNSDGAAETFTMLKKLATNTNVIVCSAIGILNLTEERTLFTDRGADIVIGTMGRIRHFIEEKILMLNEVNTLILDDAQKFVNAPDWDETCTTLLKHTNTMQTICVSSALDSVFTVSILQRVLDIENCCFIDFHHLNPKLKKIKQKLIHVDNRKRYKECVRILKLHAKSTPDGSRRYPKALVFVGSPETAEWVAATLRNHYLVYNQLDAKVATFSCYSTVNDRNTNRTIFSKGNQSGGEEIDVLVTTDLLATNVHLKPEIIINFDFPPSLTSYHDRLGRIGENGAVYSFLNVLKVDNEPAIVKQNVINVLKAMKEIGAKLPFETTMYTEEYSLPM